MALGIVSWTLPQRELGALFEKVGQLGLGALQFASDQRHYKARELREHAAGSGIGLIAIDPFDCGPEGRPSAQGAIDYYRAVVDFAAEAGQVPVTLHGLARWTTDCADKLSAYERLLSCCAAVNEHAKASGVRTLYEVCNHYELPLINTAAQCHELIGHVGAGNMGMVLDAYHMNINEADPVATLREHAALLAVYHIADSGRGGIGSGHIDFVAQYRALRQAGYEGAVAIEAVLPHLAPSSAPGSDGERAWLDEEIRRSAERWQGYAGPA
ncbi:TIM barrel protein [Pseudomonas sp. NPDC007930]|uniref:sugar phosphate isomerase/epimerase family protein n=1 Tax=Pseudomonas sp. NPDC007930 TaxID=3364417 RepID=UPI0036EFE631